MMRINLLPPEARASLRVIQTTTVLFVAGAILAAILAFGTVYLRLQVASERERLVSYQSTMSAMGRYRAEISKLEKETRQLRELVQPLEEQLVANRPAVDLPLLLGRLAMAVKDGHVWLREAAMQKDGVVPLTGYAVEFAEVSRFLAAVGRDPLAVQMGSTRWVEQGGIRLLEFSARIAPTSGGASR